MTSMGQRRHILLTGGTGGLGRAVTQQLLDEGCELTLTYLQPSALEALKQELTPAQWVRIHPMQVDLRAESEVEQLLRSMTSLDVLVHLVGGFSQGDTHHYPLEQWQQDLTLNLTTTFLVCKHSLRRMRETGYGRIVTVGSAAAVTPRGNMAGYSASKAGVVALTQAIADETKGTNITANSVLPSTIDTPNNRKNLPQQNRDQWVTPASIAQVICFLASDAAKDIRGAAIPIYGR